MSDTARKILDLAEGYLTERGYHGFSYHHVAAALDVKPAAIHYHFRTKGDLVSEVLDRYRGRFRQALQLAAHPQAVAATELVIDYRGVDRLVLGHGQRFLGRADGRHHLEVRLILEELSESRANGRMVIDDQQAVARGRGIRSIE